MIVVYRLTREGSVRFQRAFFLVTLLFLFAFPALADADPARQLLDAGNIHGALAAYDKILRKNPADADAWRGKGLCLLRLGDFQDALVSLMSASQEMGPYREKKFPGVGGYQDWSKAQEVYYEGNDLLEQKKYKEAIEKYKAALKIFPSYPQCLHNMAIALGKSGDYHAAEVACMEAISIRYSDWKFWKTLSIQLYMQNKFRLSLLAMQEAMHLDPPVPEQAEMIEDLEIVKEHARG